MSRRPATPMSSVECMIRDFKAKSCRAPRTLRFYREELATIIRTLEKGGRHTFPWEITEEDVKWLLDDYIRRDLTISTRRGYISALRTWTEYYGNDVVRRMKIRWPADMRPNVDWLTEPEMRLLQHATKTPLEEIVINLELNCGLRSVEVIRLRVQDVNLDSPKPYLDVRGKGVGNGKWRRVPFGYRTEFAVKQWLTERNRMISVMRKVDPTWVPPDNLLLWMHYSGRNTVCKAYSERGHSLDRSVIASLRESLGLSFSHHTLRRTFGRTMFHAGVNISTISRILGHEDIITTLKYIGINMDDMNHGMEIMSNYLNERL